MSDDLKHVKLAALLVSCLAIGVLPMMASAFFGGYLGHLLGATTTNNPGILVGAILPGAPLLAATTVYAANKASKWL